MNLIRGRRPLCFLSLVIAPVLVGFAPWIVTADDAPSGSADAAPAAVDFARDVAPILAGRCLRCHQEAIKKGELSLATADDLASLSYVVAGKSGESTSLSNMLTALSLPGCM